MPNQRATDVRVRSVALSDAEWQLALDLARDIAEEHLCPVSRAEAIRAGLHQLARSRGRGDLLQKRYPEKNLEENL